MSLSPRNYTRPDVWAPQAQSVELVVDGTSRPMTRDADGWWRSEEDLLPGQRYAFRVDGGDPRPDPRSVSQPDGVHGPSRIVDPALFSDRPAWAGLSLRGAVLYELHIGTFTEEGTLDAAIGRIPQLVELGVDAVELLPVATFAGDRGWGYDGVGLYAVHEAYGGPEQLVRFIDACHAAGLGVVLDVVHNHFGPEGNYLSVFGPYFTDTHETPWGAAVNLDAPGSDGVRDFLLGSVRQWICDFGIDGLRLDAVHELQDDSEPHFLAELALAVDGWRQEVGRPVTVIAEADLNQPTMVSPVGSHPQARGMDAQWADDVHHAIHSFVTGETGGYYSDFRDIQALAKVLTRVFLHDGGWSSFRDRNWGAPVDPDSPHYDGHSFVVFMQNHDQVGNRPTGDRIGHTVVPGAQAAGAALYLLGPYTPMVFMGEEWNASAPFPFFSHLGPELGPLVSEGRAREFSQMDWSGEVPDPQAEQTWRSAVLDWAERDAEPHRRMLRWYRDLIGLRRTTPQIRDESLHSVTAEVLDADTIVMRRGDVAVLATRAGDGVAVGLGATAEVLLSFDPIDGEQVDGVTLPGPGAVVLRLDPDAGVKLAS